MIFLLKWKCKRTTNLIETNEAFAGKSSTSLSCECGSVTIQIQTILEEELSARRTKDRTTSLQNLATIVGLFEELSDCTECALDEAYRWTLHLICANVLRHCRLFHSHLEKQNKNKSSFQKFCWLLKGDKPRRVYCMRVYLQTQQLQHNLSRLINMLRNAPVFDEDSWWLMQSQYQRVTRDFYRLYLP
ncbi:hypothetical protein BDV25DRAFT_155327 [Aspergillus avenaceus]|uniref:Uncharacterized protein n=1 Tax=Aspergillus avenaceus TaxID=36643 RepID=A0A5N6TUD1_ASPAV|nr:hypothetical protein BDV25DRAFT_155327 [Aspergillus avenaceus]